MQKAMGTIRDRGELAWLGALLHHLEYSYDGNPGDQVSELGHCLQTADRARRAGADDEFAPLEDA